MSFQLEQDKTKVVFRAVPVVGDTLHVPPVGKPSTVNVVLEDPTAPDNESVACSANEYVIPGTRA